MVTIFMELTASFNMFKRGWGGPGRGLTTSLHLKCQISCPTWPDILWISRHQILRPYQNAAITEDILKAL